MIRWKNLLAIALGAAALCIPAAAQHDSPSQGTRQAAWSEQTLDLAGRLPIQDGGRVKPLSTYASFTLLRLNGKRSLTTPADEKLGATEWLLDVFFYPHAAADYECFLVENREVIAAMGLKFDDKKARDRFSFFELQPGFERLYDLADEYKHLEDSQRTPVQQQIVILASNVSLFFSIVGHLDFARIEIPVGADPEVRALFDGQEAIGYSELVGKAKELRDIFRRTGEDRTSPAFALLGLGGELARSAETLALVPPAASAADEPEWLTPSDLFWISYESGQIDDEHIATLTAFEAIAKHRDDEAGFERELGGLLANTSGLADARGEYGKIGLEVNYYKSKLIMRSLVLFILAFLLAAFLWLFPKGRVGRILHGGASGAVLVATLLLCAAITIRCMIRGRPPVSTLYETLIFVTAVGAIVALITELINRKRIAVSTAAFLGMVGLFLANGYETLDKQDTMPSLVAVLDTNFWLATHVTAITIGYSAGMLAAFLASAYLLAKLVGFRRTERGFYKNLARMTYGVLAFAIIFSTVGTILGGVWANDSWGRFWGWDPKENGALLIVLAQLTILHARMGGYLREHGIAMATAFHGTVIAFSWFGTNLLGVGLHSYGFTSGIHTALWTYYYVQWGIVGLGGVAFLMERSRIAASKPDAKKAPATAGEIAVASTEPATQRP
ncbi:MAG: cytochrome c biogenesis protein CcsA [Planctomycetota bacterium]